MCIYAAIYIYNTPCNVKNRNEETLPYIISDKVFILSNTTDVFNFIILYEEEGFVWNNLINENGGA